MKALFPTDCTELGMVIVVKPLQPEKAELLIVVTELGMTMEVSCTGFKQAFIWMFLILTARGPIWHKIWYIPLGWICVYGVNVLRIAAIAGIVEFHPEMFELFHRYVFKYLFYFILFMMWVFWLEKFAPQTPSAS